jgi:hypothetical protein
MESNQRPSSTFAILMVAFVIVAALLSFPIMDKALVIDLSLWLIQFAFTYFLIARMGRDRSAFDLACTMIALAYLVWGSVFLFRPGDCSTYSPISQSISIRGHENNTRFYQSYHHWAMVCRWSWGLLAMVYAALFMEAVMSRVRRRTGRGPAEAPLSWPRRTSATRMYLLLLAEASLLLALWRLAYGWLTALGVVASSCLMAVVWRGQVSVWLTRRLVVMVRRLVPDILAGFGGLWLSVLWSYFGWSSAIAILPFLIVAVTVLGLSRTAAQRARRRPVALVLILILMFAVSARLLVPFPVSMPRDSTSTERVASGVPETSELASETLSFLAKQIDDTHPEIIFADHNGEVEDYAEIECECEESLTTAAKRPLLAVLLASLENCVALLADYDEHPGDEGMAYWEAIAAIVLVSLDRKPARNSDRMLGVPLSHFAVGPSPLEWVGVEPVVLVP